MARDYVVANGGVALVAATAKTIVELATPSTTTAVVVEIGVFFDASAAAAGIVVELVRFNTTGTGTAATPARYNGDAQMLASITTAKINHTVEPGTPTIIESWYVPNTGGLLKQLPLGRELVMLPSNFLGLRVTSAAIVNVRGHFIFEE